ncbi:MAG: hypothetical protein KAR12_01030, partial [Methylococcales bacterium]|nr:hypothetical protein [Methylococcales bacterium]
MLRANTDVRFMDICWIRTSSTTSDYKTYDSAEFNFRYYGTESQCIQKRFNGPWINISWFLGNSCIPKQSLLYKETFS